MSGQLATGGRLDSCRPEVAHGAFVALRHKSDKGVGIETIGLVGLCGPIGVVRREHGGTAVDQHASYCSGDRVETAWLADDDAAPGEAPRAKSDPFALANAGHDRSRRARTRREVLKNPQRLVPADSVARQAGVGLKVHQSSGGIGTHHAVDAHRVESQLCEPALEFGDIVAAKHRRCEIDQAVTEAITSVDQRVPRVAATDAVYVEALVGLERLDGLLGDQAKNTIGGPRGVPQARESTLKVANVVAATTYSESTD